MVIAIYLPLIEIRGLVANQCDGSLNLSAADPMKICEGGTQEWYEYGNGNRASQQTGLAYSSQHMGGMMSMNGWDKPNQYFVDRALNSYYVFKATYFKDGWSYIDDSDGGFNEATISRFYPSGLGNCGDDGFYYYKDSEGRVVNDRGETAVELISTAVSSLAHVVSYKDSNKASEIWEILDKNLDVLLVKPLNPVTVSNCAGSWTHATNVTVYSRTLAQVNNFLAAYYNFKKYALPVLPAGIPEPKSSDINEDGDTNGIDLVHAIQVGVEYPTTVINNVLSYY
jgi:hypothetical protein